MKTKPKLIRLETQQGYPIHLNPDFVVMVGTSSEKGCAAVQMRTTTMVIVKGAPDEVAKKLNS